ncbi:hypothetical protein [Luteimonas terrae]|uniref:DUF1570 domain-containing protein n=1 Tax=Luteimonas terrae TaxID=1530191 RepID=A0ABU1XUX7_9GAMM|nr:hypothetical protein [Luteimonas terrae]MDR7192403.1 hypothetical protein [Luteimonas terrae]
MPLPVPDWHAMGAGLPADADDAQLHSYYDTAAAHWLDVLADALPADYRQTGTTDFLLLSAQSARQAALVLRSCAQALRAIKESLGPLACDSGFGRHIVLVFASRDDYEAYLSQYQAAGEDAPMSSGVFINAGYGHFASWHDGLDALEAVVVHELTHALLSHLPMPDWLHEGFAVNVERTLLPRLADPRLALYRPDEMAARHADWWTEATIQAFWSGAAFHCAGEGVELAYELAREITVLAARQDEPAFRAFAAAADREDAGSAAAIGTLGYPLEHLVQAVLGAGDWAPKPELWTTTRPT